MEVNTNNGIFKLTDHALTRVKERFNVKGKRVLSFMMRSLNSPLKEYTKKVPNFVKINNTCFLISKKHNIIFVINPIENIILTVYPYHDSGLKRNKISYKEIE